MHAQDTLAMSGITGMRISKEVGISPPQVVSGPVVTGNYHERTFSGNPTQQQQQPQQANQLASPVQMEYQHQRQQATLRQQQRQATGPSMMDSSKDYAVDAW
jgi:hypothetical protein